MASNKAAAPVLLRCLGTFEVTLDAALVAVFPTDKVRALFAYLALESRADLGGRGARPHRREALASLFWPEMPQSLALTNLRLALHRLRQALDRCLPGVSDALLTITRQTVQLNQSVLAADALRFQQLLAETTAHAHSSISACDECLQRLAEAADLYHGELLAGFGVADAPAFEEWLLLHRETFQQQAMMVLHMLASRCEERADYRQAHRYTRRQLALDPYREETHRQLMRILARLGMYSEALAQYEACRRLLQQELGVGPDPATIALYEEIRRGGLSSRGNGEFSSHANEWPVARLSSAPIAAASEQPGWSDVPEVAQLYGRAPELARLGRWLAEDRCRLVAILGLGGVGKTTLAAAAAQAVAAQFDVVIWRSLLNAPSLDELVRSVLPMLSRQPVAPMPSDIDALLTLLFDAMRQRRCLLVLDNLESILLPDQPGQVRPDYAGYDQLIRAFAERRHTSCLLLTSRERPHAMALWDSPLIRALLLSGLDIAASQAMLGARGLRSTPAQAADLARRYSGNPLALKLVTQTVQELFENDIASFLATEAPIFDDIRTVLDEQFARLSPLEQEILIWLAIEREPVAVQALRDNLVAAGPPRALLEALRSLRQRSLVEQSAQGSTLQNVVTEYVTELLVDTICREVAGDTATSRQGGGASQSANSASPLPATFSALNRYALIKATAKEYVRASQERVILQPIAEQLVDRMGSARLVEKLKQVIADLREDRQLAPGYAAGNMLNLLLHLGADLRGYDFSRLTIWQAYLQGARLPEVDFRDANLARSVFTYTFGDILALHFEANGQLRVAGLANGRICLWRAADGQLLREYKTFGAGASIATFSADGRLLASADTDEKVRLWDVAHGQLLHTLSEHSETPWKVTFSPDGGKLASSGRDGVVQIWDVPTGRLEQTLQAHATGIHALAFTSDAQILASGGGDGIVHIWRLGQAVPLQAFQAHANEVQALAFDAAGTILVSGSYDHTIRLWQISGETASSQLVHTLNGHTQMIRRVVISPDGHTLASGGHDSFVCLWDAHSGQALHTLVGHAYPIHHLAFSRDGHMLATVGVDQTICLWDVASGRRLDTLRTHSSYIYTLDFSSNGQLLASGGADGVVRLWDMQAHGRAAHTFQGQPHSVYAVAFSPNGALLGVGGRDREIQLWDIHSNRVVHTLDGHTDDVEAIQFSADGFTLASASSDHTVRLWDAHAGQLIHTLRGHTDRVRACAISPDGSLVASAGHDRTIRLWNPASGQLIQTWHGHSYGIKWIVFSHDGRLLASSSYDRTMRLWDVASGQVLYAWPAQNCMILSMAFHPDGTLLATGASDNTVRLWAIPSGRLLATWNGHTDLIETVRFSPDGRTLASGSADETIRLWDVATGACMQTLQTDGPYAGMNISGVVGISAAQKNALALLGAIDE